MGPARAGFSGRCAAGCFADGSPKKRWRKLHFGVDAGTGQVVASALTNHDEDDAAQVESLLDQVSGSVSSFTGDGAYDQEGIYADMAGRHPEAAVIVPPRSTAVPSKTAGSAPTQRDRHLQHIAEYGRMRWQKHSGYTKRARAEAAIARFKRVISDAPRSHRDERCATEVAVAVHVLTACWNWDAPTTSASLDLRQGWVIAPKPTVRAPQQRLSAFQASPASGNIVWGSGASPHVHSHASRWRHA